MDSLLMDLADHYLTFFLHAIALKGAGMSRTFSFNPDKIEYPTPERTL
jgi:hypothetical protein